MSNEQDHNSTVRWARRALLAVCLCAMLICLIYELIFATLGLLAFTSDPMTIAVYVGLVPLTISTFTFLKWPIATLVIAWFFFILNSIRVWNFSNNDGWFQAFLYVHSLELGFIAASHVGYFGALRYGHLGFRPKKHAIVA